MNYPVVMGNAKIGVLYGGVLGRPIAFVIGRDDRIYSKHVAATDVSLLDRETKRSCNLRDLLRQISEMKRRGLFDSPARSGHRGDN